MRNLAVGNGHPDVGNAPPQAWTLLFNRSDRAVDLTGWKIQDGSGRSEVLNAVSVGAGEATRIALSGKQARLGNDSGEIQLVAPDGALVHKVSYGKAKDPEGWSILF